MRYKLEHSSPGRRTTVRTYPSIAEASAIMRAEYYDELNNDAHARRASDRHWSFILSEGSCALVKWNKHFQFRWKIVPMPEEQRTYRIVKTLPPEKAPQGAATETVETLTCEDILRPLTELRSAAFDLANSGHHGTYPDDIESFNEDVEEGFSDGGLRWEAKDGTVLEILMVEPQG